MIGLLFGFASLRAGSALEHTFSMPASIRKLETFTANDAVTIDGVLRLHFVKFHGNSIEKELARDEGSHLFSD